MSGNVLLFVINQTAWGSLSQLALKMKKETSYHPILLLSTLVEAKMGWCKDHGIQAIVLQRGVRYGEKSDQIQPIAHGAIAATVFSHHSKLSFKTHLFSFLKNIHRRLQKFMEVYERRCSEPFLFSNLIILLRAAMEVISIRSSKPWISTLVNDIKPVALITYVDCMGGPFAHLFSECRKQGATIIASSAAFYDIALTAVRRIPHKCCHYKKNWKTPWVIKWIKFKYPDQFLQIDDHDLLFFFPSELLALAWLGLLPPRPWIRGANFCDFVCVEDFPNRQKYMDCKVPESKIVVSGNLECDQIFEAKQKTSKDVLYKKYGFDPEKKLLIVAPLNLMEHQEVSSWEEHWTANDLLLRPVFKTGHNVLVVLHPKMDHKNYEFLEKEYSCKISHEPTKEVIAFGDIYITGGSSTSLWAIQCGLIAINVEISNYSLDCFNYFESMETFKKTEIDLYKNHLRRLTIDEEFFQYYLKFAKNDSKSFPELDGQNYQRTLKTIGLFDHHQQPTPIQL